MSNAADGGEQIEDYFDWNTFQIHLQDSCLCHLDISAAFDTIDHSILLKRLSAWFGFTHTALLWIQSYLSSRSFSVKTSGASSQSYPLTCGVPQGSVLGHLLSILYTIPVSSLIKASSVDPNLYADDTQLIISFSPDSLSESIDPPLHVIKQISYPVAVLYKGLGG